MDSHVWILLVEDEEMIAFALEDALREGGYQVKIAGSGDQAVAMLESTPHLHGLLTDIRVGRGKNGWQIARRAREINPTIAVVYMSGDSAHEYSALGVPDSIMIQKPFAPDQIVTAISTQLNRAGSSRP